MGDSKVKVANCDVTAERSKGGTLISFPDKYLSSFTTIWLFWINLGSIMDSWSYHSFLISDIPCLSRPMFEINNQIQVCIIHCKHFLPMRTYIQCSIKDNNSATQMYGNDVVHIRYIRYRYFFSALVTREWRPWEVMKKYENLDTLEPQ